MLAWHGSANTTVAFALGCLLVEASCAARRHIAVVNPSVQQELLDCATDQASIRGFSILRNPLIPHDELEMIRDFSYRFDFFTHFDALIMTVVAGDSASRGGLHVRPFAGRTFGHDYDGSRELPPRPEAVALADSITATCRLDRRTHNHSRVRVP